MMHSINKATVLVNFNCEAVFQYSIFDPPFSDNCVI